MQPIGEIDSGVEYLALPAGFKYRLINRSGEPMTTGGQTPWRTWITCEEIFNYGSVENNVTPATGVPHGYSFESPPTRPGP